MSKKDSAASTAVQSVVYCGPTIIGVAKQYSIYTNGIPATLEAKAREIPALSVLVLPLDELPAARAQLRSGAGQIFAIYTEVQRIIKGGN